MADPGHLEKMGRELKCPICLSLLKSAASLGCNHVFCNSCIMESMKSVSACPVCKVPFRRREVRPAPHMDNLVTVFKSMEVAAGFNIFTTQVAPSTKNSGDAENSGIPETVIAHQGRSKRKGSSNNSRQKNEKANNKISNQCSAMPSFPAKKRVHVTPYPVTETPLRPEKLSKSGRTDIELESNKVVDENKKGYEDRQQDSLFSPFFWLREKNDDDDDDSLEKLSAQTTANSPQPYNAPCFSDIKDSDDDRSPIKMTSTSKASVAELFDSGIFEWTQRACSPELCLTPPSKKTAGKYKPIHERDRLEVPETGISLSNKLSKMENTKTVQADGSGPTKRTICAKKRTLKRRKSRNRHSQIEDSCRENEDPKHMESPSKLNGNTKNDNNNDDVEAQASKEAFTIKSKTEKFENKDTGAVLPLSTRSKTNSDIVTDVQSYTRKRGKKLTFQPKKKHMKTSLNDIKSKVLEVVPDNTLNEANTGNQECHKAITSPQVLPCEQTEYGQGGSSADKHGEELPKKDVVESRKKGRRNHPSDIVLKNDSNKVSLASAADGYENSQTSINHPDSKSLGSKGLPQTKAFIPQNRDNILRKCGNLQSQLICAFCQSSYDTEDSGEMMHYFNGKPVDADYNGGIKVIHSHKHCTKWAPDVYFEDDLAVNLATELARSRRIKCSCCGIKGAALGCYDKSCRKSFHFTCAKLVPECRWDNENFVMLCPLHSSTEFPKEDSQSEKQRKKRSRAREEPQAPLISKTGQAMSQMWAWPSGSPCKWVLCCSALTTMEKEIISEFTKLTNVSISKTWSSAVTHVIASTDANGACKRTLKFLMGILDGKWILSVEWVKACMKAMGPVGEEKFEITVDVHGIGGGPRLGRMRAINKEPKLFSNLRFYLSGGFMPAYRGYLQDLIISAGGTILQRKPLTRDQEKLIDSSTTLVTLIIYSLEVPEKPKASDVVFECRLAEAQALADACGAKVAANSWIIESIAASKLQPLTC